MSKEVATTSSSTLDKMFSWLMGKDYALASKSSEMVKKNLSMSESLNTNMTFHGDAYNNTTQIIYNVNFTSEPTNVIKEVFPNDKDCNLVYNRLNDINSDINCYCLILQRKSLVQIIPTVSRQYKRLVIQGYCYKDKSLPSAMHNMLKNLSQSVTYLTLDNCEFDIIALSEFLRELPLLESLKLNVIITVDKDVNFCEEELPKLLQLRDFNIKSNDKLNEILDITGSASNIESLTLFEASFDIDMIKNKNSLTTLSLTKCIVDTSFMSNLGSLHFDSCFKPPSLQHLIDLTVEDCEIDMIVLSKFLREFPFLESLNLNVFIAKNSICKLSEEDLPNLKQLKDFHIKPNDKLNEILDITRSASNIQSLTLLDAIFDEILIKYLIKYKNSLTSLSLTKCIVDTSFMSNLNSLYFGSNVKISPMNFKTFDCLNKLRKLELFYQIF